MTAQRRPHTHKRSKPSRSLELAWRHPPSRGHHRWHRHRNGGAGWSCSDVRRRESWASSIRPINCYASLGQQCRHFAAGWQQGGACRGHVVGDVLQIMSVNDCALSHSGRGWCIHLYSYVWETNVQRSFDRLASSVAQIALRSCCDGVLCYAPDGLPFREKASAGMDDTRWCSE